jgi:Sec-independent protein translocase protein TatA
MLIILSVVAVLIFGGKQMMKLGRWIFSSGQDAQEFEKVTLAEKVDSSPNPATEFGRGSYRAYRGGFHESVDL